MREVLDDLDADDDEHPSVSLTHESEWCLAAYVGGALIWENLETSSASPRHMKDVPRGLVLELWVALSRGDLPRVEQEKWLVGYG
jgi:hypothetical protein